MTKFRVVVAALAAIPLWAAPGIAQAATPAAAKTTSVGFTLNAKVLDGGEQVTSVRINTSKLGKIKASSLTTSTFTVHAKSTSPVTVGSTDAIYSLYDEDRVITGVSLTKGDVVITFKTGQGVSGASTLGYFVPGGDMGAARNVLLNLTYTITQNSPLTLTNGKSVTISSFTQGKLSDPEVDAFAYGSSNGIKYRLYTPATHSGKRPLIVWLHGNGEGGLGTAGATNYNNESPLRANRGALAMTGKDAQKLFGNAYVVAPQVPDTWYNIDSAGYATKIKALINSVVKKHKINTDRIYVMGASAGGMMTLQMAGRYPSFFAAATASAPAIYVNRNSAYTVTEEQLLKLKTTPTWLVQATNDATIDYTKSSLWAYDLLKEFGSVNLTTYDNVTWNGVTYNGHWSWVYTAHNDPSKTVQNRYGNSETVHVWQWMAGNKR